MRVKRGVSSHAKHKKISIATKGMQKSHRSSVKRGKQAITRSLQYAYRDRRVRKRTFRELWNARINAAARLNGTTYSKLIGALKNKKIYLNRKMLADIATTEPKAFEAIVKITKTSE